MKTVTYITMDNSEFDALVKKWFPVVWSGDYDIVADLELSNDSSHNLGEIRKDMFEKEINLEQFLLKICGVDNNVKYFARSFLLFFVAFDILPEGEYLIEVSW